MYPPYVIAPTKATWENGFPLPPQFLSLQTDAQAFATVTGGVLSDGVDFYKQFGFDFVLDPSDPRRPWVVTINGNTNWAGVSLAIQNGPNSVNGGGVGNPGAWVLNVSTKAFDWVPTAPPPPPPPAQLAPSSGDASAFAQLQGVPAVAPAAAQAETLYLLRAMGHLLNIPAFAG